MIKKNPLVFTMQTEIVCLSRPVQFTACRYADTWFIIITDSNQLGTIINLNREDALDEDSDIDPKIVFGYSDKSDSFEIMANMLYQSIRNNKKAAELTGTHRILVSYCIKSNETDSELPWKAIIESYPQFIDGLVGYFC